MRYLGIDYGKKRIGLSISDENSKMAFPFAVITNDNECIKKITSLIQKEKIEAIVIGESKNFKGEPNQIMRNIKEFILKLEEANIPIHSEPEFMTSAQAERTQGKNDMLDASAATIILQSYLDRS